MTVTTPEACNYESLYVSQLLSTPNMTEYSHLHNPDALMQLLLISALSRQVRN